MDIFDLPQFKSLMSSEDITEIMVNGWDQVFVEHNGIIVQTAAHFDNEQQYLDCVEDILKSHPRHNEKKFSYDGHMANGHRYNVTLPPVSSIGPILTIRKHSKKVLNLAQLVKNNFISEKAALFLKAAVAGRLTIVISGGTGSGKTSFLNSLSQHIPEDQRVISIEDTLELKSNHVNWLHLQTIDTDHQKFTARDALKNCLRMRPDRIIVGECRGSEGYDMLQAINTGHEGSMTTIHSNSAQECLFRLENLINLGNPEIPVKFIRHQISESIDLVIQVKRHPNGFRQVTDIIELTGMNHDTITRAPIFGLNHSQQLDVLDYVPECLKKINAEGQVIPSHLFDRNLPLKKAS